MMEPQVPQELVDLLTMRPPRARRSRRSPRRSNGTRDVQKARVYAAERRMPRLPLLHGEVKSFAESVTKSPWWREHYKSKLPVKVRVRNKGVRGWARMKHDYMLVSFPPNAFHKVYVLHELAHLVTYTDHEHRSCGHGEAFVRVLHEMFAMFLGEDAAKQYELACRQEGVRGLEQPAPTEHTYKLAAGAQTASHAPTGALTGYESSYRRYRKGERSSAPKLRKGMDAEAAKAIRNRVDQEFN